MRGLFLVVLLVLTPIGGAVNLPPSSIKEFDDGHWYEAVITSDEERWNSSLWNDVIDLGAVPLRVIGEYELLVWWNDDLEIVGNYEIIEAGAADWRYSLDFAEYRPEMIKILFEPRLPSFAYTQIYQEMSKLGIIAKDLIDVEYSVMPHKITVPLTISVDVGLILSIPGVLWVEPVLPAESRNLVASAYMSDGHGNTQPHWSYGLNGDGIVLGGSR